MNTCLDPRVDMHLNADARAQHTNNVSTPPISRPMQQLSPSISYRDLRKRFDLEDVESSHGDRNTLSELQVVVFNRNEEVELFDRGPIQLNVIVCGTNRWGTSS